MKSQTRKEWLLPIAIILSGLVLAVAIYIVRHHPVIAPNGHPELTRPVATSDHVLGNPAAPVVLIEYSDMDTSYSKDFQQVMEQIMQNYGADGNVAWVYRHFPIVDEDQNAEEDAEAAECVAALGGTNDFFSFINALQSVSPGDNVFNPSGYDVLVTNLGLASGSFDSCLTAHTYQKQVLADYQNALQIGATGSPYSILEVKGQKPIVISGSVPYDTMKQIIDDSVTKALGQSGAQSKS